MHMHNTLTVAMLAEIINSLYSRDSGVGNPCAAHPLINKSGVHIYKPFDL